MPTEPKSSFFDDAPFARRRTNRAGLGAAAFAVFLVGCLLLGFSNSLGQTVAGVALECIAGVIVAIGRARL